MMLSTFPVALDVTYASVSSTTLLWAFGVFPLYADDVRLMHQDLIALLDFYVANVPVDIFKQSGSVWRYVMCHVM